MDQSHQKSYGNAIIREGIWEGMNNVNLKVSPMKAVKRFGKQRKLSVCYIGPYDIVGHFYNVSYELALPIYLAALHTVFHVSLKKKCIGNPASVVNIKIVGFKISLPCEEVPVENLDRSVCMLRNKEVSLLKVLQKNESIEEGTEETEADMMTKYPNLFPSN